MSAAGDGDAMAGTKPLLRRFGDPEVLRKIELNRLHQLLVPHGSAFRHHGYELHADPEKIDLEGVARVLMEHGVSMPPPLIDALTHIQEVAAGEGIDQFIDRARHAGVDVPVGDELTPEDIALLVWLERPDILRRFHAEQVVLRRRSFLTYAPEEDFLRPRPPDLSERITSLGHAVRAWYRDGLGRGEGAYLIDFNTDRELRLVIPHGAHFRREGCIEDGGPSSVAYRPMQFAYVVLDWDAMELRVNADTQKQRGKLVELVGDCLFDSPGLFRAAEKFSLEPLRRGAASLICTDVPGVERVTVTQLVMRLVGPYGRKRTEEADDVLLALDRGGERLPADAVLVSARMEFLFADRSKARPVQVTKGNKAAYTRTGDADLIDEFLMQRGFARKAVCHVATA
jgi:hypothetical protein